MKTIMLSLAILCILGFLSSCDKSKDCTCEQITIMTDPDFGTNDTITATMSNTIQEGECSDLNAEQTVTMLTMTQKTVLTCKEN